MTKMKGIFKGVKYISKIFVYKEHEMEIGFPTDVRHVAHIGWDDDASGTSPSWMKEFKASSELGEQKGTPRTPKVDRSRDARPASALFADAAAFPCSEKPKTPTNVKQKKTKAFSPTPPSVSPKAHQTRGVRGRSSIFGGADGAVG